MQQNNCGDDRGKPSPGKKVINIISIPAHLLHDALLKIMPKSARWNKKLGRGVCGLLLMLGGATMSLAHPGFNLFALEVLWDTTAWGLHGFGAAPFFKMICEAFSCFDEWL